MTRLWVSIVACAGLALASASGAAPPDKKDRGHADQRADTKGKGSAKSHKHAHVGGRQALGSKLKQDGKHAIGKFANRTVTAEVKGGKVKNMSAGDLPMKRVKTKTKMASQDSGLIRASWSGSIQLAQYDPYYYGYCFDDGYDYYCYWYPQEEVEYDNYYWEDYNPYY